MYGAESRARDGAGDRAKKVLVLSPLARKTSHSSTTTKAKAEVGAESFENQI